MQKYKEQLNNIKKEEELDSVLSLEQPLIVFNENDKELELDPGSDKSQFVMLQVNPVPRKKTVEETEKEEEENELICLIINYDKDGNVLSYSIGLNRFSNEFHDISDLKINVHDFINQLHDICSSSRNSRMLGQQAITAFREKFPGSRTFIDNASQTRANELHKDLFEKHAVQEKEKEAGGPSITPFSTTPKPW